MVVDTFDEEVQHKEEDVNQRPAPLADSWQSSIDYFDEKRAIIAPTLASLGPAQNYQNADHRLAFGGHRRSHRPIDSFFWKMKIIEEREEK